MFKVYSLSLSFQLRDSQFAFYLFLLAGVGTYFLFHFMPHQRTLRKRLDLPLLRIHHHHHGFLQDYLFLYEFQELFLLVQWPVGLPIVHRIYNREQFTKPTSQFLIFIKTLNTRWCFYLHHCISADID